MENEIRQEARGDEGEQSQGYMPARCMLVERKSKTESKESYDGAEGGSTQ